MQARALHSAATPLAETQISSLAAFVQGFTSEQLLWTSGYLAGLAARAETAANVPAPTIAEVPARAAGWLVLYGSQTGHGRTVAERLVDSLRDKGLGAELA